MGTSLEDIFLKLSFLALPVIPSLRITDEGLFDVDKWEIVAPILEEPKAIVL